MRAIERILPAVESHPLHRYLGVDRIHAGEGRSRIEIKVGDGAVNPRGAFHGGVAYTLCDMACYAALLSELKDDEDAATHDLHVSVMRAAKHGDHIIATGRVIKRGRNVAFMEAELHCEGKLLARATVTKSILQTQASG